MFSLRDKDSILVLSPRIDPPLMLELGSIARIANRSSLSRTECPIASMKVDFPTPGGPEIPILILCVC